MPTEMPVPQRHVCRYEKKEEREGKVRGGVSKRDEISLEMQYLVLWFLVFVFIVFLYNCRFLRDRSSQQ